MGHTTAQTTVRRFLTPIAFFISVLLSAQALAFEVDGLSYTVLNATDVEVTGRASGNTNVNIVIPATASNGTTTYSVTAIGDHAFESNFFLSSVTIGNNVKTIGEYAFFANFSLYSVTISDSVTTIGEYAFALNTLTSVTIPGGVTTIGEGVFACQASLSDPSSGSGSIAEEILSEFLLCRFDQIGSGNRLTTAVFLGAYPSDGTFNFTMFGRNASLTTITYCQGATGWENPTVAFDIGLISDSVPILVTATAVDCPAAPGAPTDLFATPGDGQAVIVFSAGLDNYSSITNYQYNLDGGGFTDLNPAVAVSPIIITELTNGTSYSIRLKAINGAGSSVASDAVTATLPILGAPPSMPEITSIDSGDAEVSISVSVAENGDSPIISYSAYCIGSTGYHLGTSPTSPITVSGLANGVSYVCLVTATNDGGTSPASALSEPVTPVAPPPGC